MAKDIPFFYGGWVDYWNNSTYPGTEIRRSSGVGFSSDNLEEINKQLDYYLDYYANQLGYEIQDFSIVKNCAYCHSFGIVYYGKRIRRGKVCPFCKGKPGLEVIVSWKHWKEIRK